MSKYDDVDKQKYKDIASNFKRKAKRIHQFIKNHNFDEPMTGELLKLRT